jgi:hypothetical protein
MRFRITEETREETPTPSSRRLGLRSEKRFNFSPTRKLGPNIR